jgi:hypothetical protein
MHAIGRRMCLSPLALRGVRHPHGLPSSEELRQCRVVRARQRSVVHATTSDPTIVDCATASMYGCILVSNHLCKDGVFDKSILMIFFLSESLFGRPGNQLCGRANSSRVWVSAVALSFCVGSLGRIH